MYEGANSHEIQWPNHRATLIFIKLLAIIAAYLMEVFMFRKAAVITVSLFVILGGMQAVPAAAAKKGINGVACSKANSTRTVSGNKYRCAKNPLVRNSKLTWLSFECLTAAKQVKTAARAQKDLQNSGEQTAQLDADYQVASTALTNLNAAYEKARAQVLEFQAKRDAATNAADKAAWSAAATKVANAVLVLASSRTKLTTQVRDLEAKKELLLSAPDQLKDNVTDARASAKLLCTKGL
jgi:hypothetical protein